MKKIYPLLDISTLLFTSKLKTKIEKETNKFEELFNKHDPRADILVSAYKYLLLYHNEYENELFKKKLLK
jgi:hypothetical protein